MNARKMIYTRQARWYVDLVVTVDRAGTLRCALVLITPFVRHFVEFPTYTAPTVRIERAALFVARRLEEEAWFRRPRDIRAGSKELTHALRDAIDVPVRTDRGSRRLELARELFQKRVRLLSRTRAWSAADTYFS